MLRAFVASVSFLTLAACGAKHFDSLCTAVPPPSGCGSPCDPAPGAPSSCDTGYFCSEDGKCDIQCTVNGGQCGEGYECTLDGRCVDDGKGGGNGPDASCPAVNFTPMPTTPSIGLVLDQSGSMFQNGVPTRYTQMKDALVGPTGVVSQLESKAYFGSELYTCGAPNGVGPLELTSVPRTLNNAGAIRTSLNSKTSGGNTPTHAAIDAMVASFQANPPPAGSPPVIVLATDGIPNTCSNTGAGGESASVAAARAAFAAGIPVYVLAIEPDAQSMPHFQDLANAGQGWQPGQPNVTYYPTQNATQLKQAFDTIINGVISCDLALTSAIDPAQAMDGIVTVNGMQLMYGTDWILVNGNVIRLVGGACTRLKSTPNPSVSATFPCGSVIL